MYLPTMAIVTSPSGSGMRVDDLVASRRGRAAARRGRNGADLIVEALVVIADPAPGRWCRRRAPGSPRSSRTLQNSAIFCAHRPGSAGRSGTAACRLNSEAEQLLDRVLRRLGLQLAGRGNIRHQRQMDEQRACRGRARCRAAGSPRGTAGSRCRRPCRRSRTGRNPRR